MSLIIEWSLNPHNSGTYVEGDDGYTCYTLSHPSEKKESLVAHYGPRKVIYLGVVALVSWYRKMYGLTIEEALSHGMIHELSHWGSPTSDLSAIHAAIWNEFLVSVIRPLKILTEENKGRAYLNP